MDPQKETVQITTNHPIPKPLPDFKSNQTLKKVIIFTIVILLFTLVFSSLAYLFFTFSKKQALVAENSNGFPTTPSIIPTTTPISSTNSATQSRVPLPIPPQTKIIPMRTHVFQTFNNCGPATLSMALSYFNITQSQKTLGDSLRPYQISNGDNDDKSVFLAEISTKAREYGLVAYHRPAGDIQMLQYFIANDIPVITRTWLNTYEDISHYRLVRGYDQTTGEIIQDDSYTNKNLRFSYQDFLTLWQSFNYEYIVIATPDKQGIIEQILGENLRENNAWEKSLAISQSELQNNPNNYYAKFNASIALYHLGRFQESIQNYEAIKDNLPRRMLWYQLEPLLAYYQVGNYNQLLSLIQNILDNGNRAYSELYYLRAKVYENQGQSELAKQNYSLAKQYNSSSYWLENLVTITE